MSNYRQFNTKYGPFIYYRETHQGRSKIPAKLQHARLLSCIRMPYDRYVSIFEFGWWRRRDMREHFRQIQGLRSRFPRFPDLSFREFLTLMHEMFMPPPWRNFDDASAPGINTWQFVRFFAPRPFRLVRPQAPKASELRKITRDVLFLHTHRLNADLYDALTQFGLRDEDLSFLPLMDRVLPFGKGRDRTQRWEDYYDDDLQRLVRQKDSGLFECFPEFES